MHPVERKLRYEILPYLVSAQHLRSWRPMKIYRFHAYAGEVFVCLSYLRALESPTL
jgi:hypothetical protein